MGESKTTLPKYLRFAWFSKITWLFFHRYLVAARDFSEGEIIFEDQPLASGPNQETLPICLTCDAPVRGCETAGFNVPFYAPSFKSAFTLFQVDLSYFCPGCRYPFCDSSCASHPGHAAECAVLGRDTTPFSPSYSYHAVVPLRLLLSKAASPRRHSMTSRLMDHRKSREGGVYWNESQITVVDR